MDRVSPPLHPFRYPPKPHVRKHGPAGYQSYRDYRPWLEDEFKFRCVYCLKRQVWAPTDVWSVDHLVPQSEAPELECAYDNLILTCQWCNNRKLASTVPDPVAVAYGNCLQVDESSGLVRHLNEDGEILLRVLKLNHPKSVEMRLLWIRSLKGLSRCSSKDWKRLMGFPQELPDLTKHRPPQGNSRPQGLSASWSKARRDGTLPECYEF